MELDPLDGGETTSTLKPPTDSGDSVSRPKVGQSSEMSIWIGPLVPNSFRHKHRFVQVQKYALGLRIRMIYHHFPAHRNCTKLGYNYPDLTVPSSVTTPNLRLELNDLVFTSEYASFSSQ